MAQTPEREEQLQKMQQDAAADLERLNAGQMTFAEFQQRRVKAAADYWRPELLELRAAGKWQEFITFALTRYEIMPDAFLFYDEIPDSLKYDFCTAAYQHHGDSVPAVREAVKGALKYGKPTLPAELAEADEITVYRAGTEGRTAASTCISWTTSKDVALFFLNRDNRKKHLYRGKIKPAGIICYTDERKESEIMQYRSVYDVIELKERGQ